MFTLDLIYLSCISVLYLVIVFFFIKKVRKIIINKKNNEIVNIIDVLTAIFLFILIVIRTIVYIVIYQLTAFLIGDIVEYIDEIFGKTFITFISLLIISMPFIFLFLSIYTFRQIYKARKDNKKVKVSWVIQAVASLIISVCIFALFIYAYRELSRFEPKDNFTIGVNTKMVIK